MILNKIYTLDEKIKMNLHIPGLDFEKALSDDEVDDFDEKMNDILLQKGFDENYKINEIGLFFEDMMYKLRDYEDKYND